MYTTSDCSRSPGDTVYVRRATVIVDHLFRCLIKVYLLRNYTYFIRKKDPFFADLRGRETNNLNAPRTFTRDAFRSVRSTTTKGLKTAWKLHGNLNGEEHGTWCWNRYQIHELSPLRSDKRWNNNDYTESALIVRDGTPPSGSSRSTTST